MTEPALSADTEALSAADMCGRLVAVSEAYLALSEAVVGPPGGTCIQAEKMADEEWLRRQWRNAIDQWRWWKKEAEHLGGEQPITLVIRAKNWESRARHAEALLRQHGIDPHFDADGVRNA